MKIQFLILLSFLISCNQKIAEETTTTTAAINSSAPYLWANRSFPKAVHLSANFKENEINNIVAMSDAWKTALQDKRTFFAYGNRTPEISNTLNNLDSMLDGVLGIYRTENWPPALPGSALAVTQIFGRRHNIGTPNEFVNIEHADILINFDIHDFDSTDSGPNYDLRTVILHEMGHFLGLTHKSYSSNPDSSVMYPSINSSTSKRAPRQVDIMDLAEKYGISLSGGGTVNSAIVDKNRYVVDPRDAGEPVKILLELHADGECVHRINGKIKERHTPPHYKY